MPSSLPRQELRVMFRAFANTLLVIAASLSATVAAAQGTQSSPNATAAEQATVKDFNQRLQQYLDARKKAEPGSPPQSSDAAKLVDYRQKLRSNLISARAGAKQGDIFAPRIATYFKHQIAATLSGPHGRQIRASLSRAEPVHGVPLKINAGYPANVPLQSTPPSLLLNLPPLPKELEYRVADRALVLRDKDANLIVDLIPNIIAPVQAPTAHHSQPTP
jgi:hypothetical protein